MCNDIIAVHVNTWFYVHDADSLYKRPETKDLNNATRRRVILLHTISQERIWRIAP
jgi:hypothetical protein